MTVANSKTPRPFQIFRFFAAAQMSAVNAGTLVAPYSHNVQLFVLEKEEAPCSWIRRIGCKCWCLIILMLALLAIVIVFAWTVKLD